VYIIQGAQRHKVPLGQPAVQAQASPVQRDEPERVQAVKVFFGYFLQRLAKSDIKNGKENKYRFEMKDNFYLVVG
jgi:hypothetical protein